MTKNVLNGTRKIPQITSVVTKPVKQETDQEILQKLTERFSAMDLMTENTLNGVNRSLIVSGPAGLGKSYGIMKMADAFMNDKSKQVTIIKGFVRPTGLYKTLYENRHAHCVVIFDDADSIFTDDVSMNLLKAACDMTEKRHLHWLAETNMKDEDDERLPRNFEFEGSIIFITNYDFDDFIQRGNRLAPHFQALISRSIYLDLEMKTARDYMIRIQQVLPLMLVDLKLSQADGVVLMNFIEKNCEKLRELSLRMVVKLATIYKMNRVTWESLARVTCFKNKA